MDMSTSLVSKFLLFLLRLMFSSNLYVEVKLTQLTVLVKNSVFVFLYLEIHLDLFNLLCCLWEGGHHRLDPKHMLNMLRITPLNYSQNVPYLLLTIGHQINVFFNICRVQSFPVHFI